MGNFFSRLRVIHCLPPSPKQELLGPIIAAVIGGLLVGSIILFDSLVGDLSVINKKEGIYFGFWKMSTKFSRALGNFITGVLLSAIGFEEKLTIQSTQTLDRIAILFGPVVGIFFIFSSFIYLRIAIRN